MHAVCVGSVAKVFMQVVPRFLACMCMQMFGLRGIPSPVSGIVLPQSISETAVFAM